MDDGLAADTDQVGHVLAAAGPAFPAGDEKALAGGWFTPAEIVADAPDNAATTYDDLERTDRGPQRSWLPDSREHVVHRRPQLSWPRQRLG